MASLAEQLKQILAPKRPIGAVRAEVKWHESAPNLHVRYFAFNRTTLELKPKKRPQSDFWGLIF